VETAGPLVSAQVAVPTGDGLDPRQDPRPTDRRHAGLPLQWAVEDLNRVLRGWGNYFRYGNSDRKFDQIDCYVNERLAILASAKHGLTGRNWVSRFNYEWTTKLGLYRLTGTVKPTLAYASR
jgi:RNA-directed DNA polymerase